ncbi:AAA family ATPase [Candidatus Bathyarchaeota archaeon]|nr:AAA family ATPase [Candidatus Bathyarchaeota archaeon]
MLNYLNLQGYKITIGKQLELFELSKVNYLVGENSAGKSAVLEGIALAMKKEYYTENEQNTVQFIKCFGELDRVFHEFNLHFKDTNSEVKINLDESSLRNGQLKVVKHFHEGTNYDIEQRYKVFYLTTNRGNYQENPLSENIFFNLDNTPENFPKDNIINFINRYKFWDKKVVDMYRSLYKNIVIQLKLEDGTEINLKSLASGYIALLGFYYSLISAVQTTKPEPIICIEEPESNFHPSFQKLIPKILEEFAKDRQITIFVTTHSPFIISKSGEYKDNQKVYMLKDGQTIDESFTLGEGKSGFNGKKIANVVAAMLGANETDLGYPENYCILEEDSLRQLLEPLKEANIIKDIAFISSSGWKKANNLSERIKNFDSERTLLKCNPFYQDKYCVIVDKVPDDEKEEPCYQKLSLLGDRFIQLSKHSIEDFYPEEIKSEFNNEIDGVEEYSQQGIIKGNYARKVAELILESPTPKEKFSEIFNRELDFLLVA